MSTTSLEKSTYSEQDVSLSGLKTGVGVKDRKAEYEIHDSSKAGLETVIDLKDACTGLKSREKDATGLTITKPEELRGSHPNRLVHIKGARRMQMRIVSPETKSFSIYDSYVLFTPNKVMVWNGKSSTIMKKAKANDFAQDIVKRREYGVCCRNAQTFEHLGKTINAAFSSFLTDPNKEIIDHKDIKDAEFEDSANKLNRVFEFKSEGNDCKLVICEKMNGKLLKRPYLDSSNAYLFDFGTEVYLWFGSKYPKSTDKKEIDTALEYIDNSKVDFDDESMKFAKEMMNRGYYFPVSPSKRPEWIVVEKINDKCETILFKKKFLDWADHDLKISPLVSEDKKVKKRNKIKLDECYKDMSPREYIVLGTVINRGKGGKDPETDFIYRIRSQSVNVYRLTNMEFVKADDEYFPFFYSCEAYLVEWKFIYQRCDIKTLSGEDVDTENSGRDVCFYFYWQGRDCSVTEKGISAVLTIFHVNKKAHQIHMGQDSESPTFVSLFKNRYSSIIGKQNTFDPNTNHLFLIRGLSEEDETFVIEVKPDYDSLRARSHFLFIMPNVKTVYHWSGSMSKKNAEVNDVIQNIKLLFKNSTDFKIEHIAENKEPDIVKKALNYPTGSNFKMLGTSIVEFCCYFRKQDQYNIECHKKNSALYITQNNKGYRVNYDKFSIDQHDLYSLIQPALVLICTTSSTYLWHGWMSLADEDNADELKIAEVNILQDKNFLDMKRNVLEDLIPFLKENSFCDQISEIHAGVEPDDFIHLFPTWKVREDIQALQIKLGRVKQNSPNVITEESLAEKIFYPLEILRKRPLPENVDPELLENYLTEKEFFGLFNMKKEAYDKLPKWKKLELKKTKNLF